MSEINALTGEDIQKLEEQIRLHPTLMPLYGQFIETVRQKDAQIMGLVEALEAVIKTKFTTYKARNGRDVGIEDEFGEMCYIVPHEAIWQAEQALSSLPTDLLEQHKLERAVIEVAKDWEAYPNMGNEKRLLATVKALKEMESK